MNDKNRSYSKPVFFNADKNLIELDTGTRLAEEYKTDKLQEENINKLHELVNPLHEYRHALEIIPDLIHSHDFNKLSDYIKEATNIISDLKPTKMEYTLGGKNLNDFILGAPSTNNAIRAHIEKESFDKALDVKHRITLTVLKVAQIFIFVFAAYFSVAAAIGTLGYFGLNKDLAIPRGLITIVPNNLILSSQTGTASSAAPETAKNTESVTNSVTLKPLEPTTQ
ncbi:MAG: hypothetical protein RPR91_02795 [Colwellia sp.]